jgi:carboxymethylenebutenolidase
MDKSAAHGHFGKTNPRGGALSRVAASNTGNRMITTGTVTLATEGGRTFEAYCARQANGRWPGLVVLTEMFGVNGPMREVAEGYARRGFSALVPNLFWRSEHTGALAYEGPDREIAWARLAALDVDTASHDMRTAVAWLRDQPFCSGRIAAIGFCAGGRMAFLAAARAGVDAAVSLYALGISKHAEEFGAVRCPLQLHYGLQDQHVPQQEVDAVAYAARGHPSVELHLYPDAGHSFANPVRPTYDAAAAQLAASRIDRLLATIAVAIPGDAMA